MFKMASAGNTTELPMNVSGPVDPTLIFGPQRDTLYIVLPITIIYTFIFITGVLGNIFTCIVIVRNKSMHTATNYYLFSLAMSDLLLLISGMPQEMYSIWSKWPYVFGYTFCVIRGLAAETSTNASVLTITLFTIERYLAICHPFVSHQMSKLSRATKHVILLWVVALGSALPQALQFGIRKHKGVTMCLQTRVIIEHSFEISTFVFFFTPMVLITVLYLLIGLKLSETSITREQNQKEFEASIKQTHKIRRKHSQSTKRVIKMLVAVVIAFFVCWAPFHAQRLVAIYGTTENHLAKSPILLSVYSFLTYISGIFYYMSTCINPFFYHIMSNKFRDAFKNTMISWCCRTQEGAAIKRCSYTAMAFVRNPTTSGTVNSEFQGTRMAELKETKSLDQETELSKSREANWPAVLFLIHIHLLSLYGVWLLFYEVKWMTLILLVTLVSMAVLGMTTGAHRLWAHRTYKAHTGLRIALMLFQTLAGVGPIYDWVKQHRFHHAHFATNDDPYDFNKGFFHAHILTRMRKLSPHQEKLKEAIDMSDLENDSVVMFQKTVYWLLYAILFLLLPLNAPLEYWNDTVLSSVFVIGFLRYAIVLYAAWLIESGVCLWGLKPGEKSPPDSNSVFIISKSFWPQYHYLIPYDYKSGEYGTYDSGCSTAFIRVWAALGLATDLRTVESKTIQRALAEVAKTKRSLQTCLDEALKEQHLPEDHYLKRG